MEQGPYDELVARLHGLRADAGLPSYGEIAARVSRIRRERGASPEQARVGRTTVYDAFRLGRQRIDADLVGDIARALGSDEEAAARWAVDALEARGVTVPATTPAGGPTPDSGAPRADDPPVPDTPARVPRPWLAGVLVASVVVNLLGRGLVDLLALPVYLDMVGTACATILLGPWWGALVGASTNTAGVAVSGLDSLLFLPVNVLGALIWGYGVRNRSLVRSIPRFFLLNLVVAVTCSSLAVPIIVMLEQGFSGRGTDLVTRSALVFLGSIWASVTISNLLTSVVDKLISGFVALTVLESLPSHVRAAMPRGWLRAA
ncbi:hypothetical protein GCM10011376_20630 [Nocardioides flavus (ex Wang et al. 2016)]|uniref:Energy-coupling factor transport system substrate-specific component n=1 Tax=Nocardioides flavus (ex Wang et al. 2016) TaxID=2058780 RepID=A0ABQ3HII0_9ACTN|nr:ECF transporter S component [Nocardioides flavus (ex Wang et al. 2016)]GHE17453.1 hypothetical protein GCM10011376_20630 [Nocardioides flavus (ex Wang et al. 2016)]